MKLWKKVIGAIKDKNSLAVVYISRRNSLRNPDLEAAIIKATCHDEHRIDKRKVQIVLSWIRASPISIRPLLRALSKRMEKTRSWVVAIKGLMLMHGVFHCKVPVVKLMQRLPFDLSSFSDGHSKASQTWGFNCIIREYFAFLDQRAAVYSSEQYGGDDDDDDDDNERSLMVQQVLRLEKWQSLLDMLIQIRPPAENMKVNLILEVMDCVINEIFDVYGILCSEIAKVVLNIYSFNKFEASMVLKVLQRARKQGEELNLFFEFCREFGVSNAIQLPIVIQIPEGVEEELERIINGVPVPVLVLEYKQTEMETVLEEHSKGGLKTIITDKWVVFDEEKDSNVAEEEEDDDGGKNLVLPPLVSIDNVPVYYKDYEVPDLICF